MSLQRLTYMYILIATSATHTAHYARLVRLQAAARVTIETTSRVYNNPTGGLILLIVVRGAYKTAG